MTAARRISVVIPCYNAEEWVARAIQSVLDQPGVEPEVIVIDDGSTDRSPEVVRGLGDCIRFETCLNRGACAARNRGLELATAEYVMFLDADDYLEIGVLAEARPYFADRSDVVVSGYRVRSADGLSAPVCYDEYDRAQNNAILMYLSKLVQTASFIWSKRFIESVGGWDETLYAYQDIDIVLRAFIRSPVIAYVHEPTAVTIYDHLSSKSRITDNMNYEKWFSILSVLNRADRIAESSELTELKSIVGEYYYGLAVGSYSCGFTDIGAFALSRAHRLGYPSGALRRAIMRARGAVRRLSRACYELPTQKALKKENIFEIN